MGGSTIKPLTAHCKARQLRVFTGYFASVHGLAEQMPLDDAAAHALLRFRKLENEPPDSGRLLQPGNAAEKDRHTHCSC